MTAPDSLATPDAPALSLPARVVGVFTSPRSTFARVVAHPEWIGPLVLTLLVSAVSLFAFLSTQVGREAMLDQQIAAIEGFGQTVTDEMYEVLKSRASNPWPSVIGMVATVVVWRVLSAGVLHLIFTRLFGAPAAFKQTLAVVTHAGLMNALQFLFGTPLNYARGSMSSVTSLGVFFPFLPEGSFLSNLFGAIDLFTLWGLLILAIGLGVLFKRRTAPIMTALTAAYLLVALATAAFKAAFGNA